MEPTDEFMPIFVVIPGLKMITAAHPSEATKADYSPPSIQDEADVLSRIGTMVRNKDGSWTISLIAVPPSGHLLARPPIAGETRQVK